VRVLGIDPGSVRTGWGVVERSGSKLIGIAAGVIEAGSKDELHERLPVIYDGLRAVILEHQPTTVAVEDIFYARNVQSALKLGHARGVALLAAGHAGLDVSSYPPAVVKRTVAGRGSAEKEQVAQIVGAILGWKTLPAIDATDALAIAITHAQASRMPTAAPASRPASAEPTSSATRARKPGRMPKGRR
jgi:crossover junction endodeoxyribonuclease RuvC